MPIRKPTSCISSVSSKTAGNGGGEGPQIGDDGNDEGESRDHQITMSESKIADGGSAVRGRFVIDHQTRSGHKERAVRAGRGMNSEAGDWHQMSTGW